MVDIHFYFEEYRSQNESKYNCPHKHKLQSIADPTLTEAIAERWQRTYCGHILEEINLTIEEYFLSEEKFYFLSPPTSKLRREIFFDPIETSVLNRFKAISLSSCFSKRDPEANAATAAGYNVVKDNLLVDEVELKRRLKVQHRIVIFDDVYATGNTIRAIQASLDIFLSNLEYFVVTLVKVKPALEEGREFTKNLNAFIKTLRPTAK